MSREVQGDDSYLDRVKKLIPAEVSAGFLAINSAIPLNSDFNSFVIGFFAALAVLCALYLLMIEKVTSIAQIVFITVVAFPVWAVNIAIARIDWLQDKAFLAPCLLILVTLIIPLLVRKTAR